jgi:hypothetical protein
MKISNVFQCPNRLKEGLEYVEDDEISGQDIIEQIKMLKKCGIW